MIEDRSGLSLAWMELEDEGESFAAMRALPEAEKKALYAAAVARTLKGQLAYEPDARPEFEATVARLDIDFAKHVRPSAAMFWSRITKDRILAVARATLGPVWASARAKYKKADLALRDGGGLRRRLARRTERKGARRRTRLDAARFRALRHRPGGGDRGGRPAGRGNRTGSQSMARRPIPPPATFPPTRNPILPQKIPRGETPRRTGISPGQSMR